MGYFDSTGFVHGEQVLVLPSAARTAAGSGPGTRTEQYTTARLTVDVTAVGGTSPSATVTIETSHDGATWVGLGSFPAVTAVGKTRKAFSGLDNHVRATWTVAGTTPSLTFSVSGALL